MRVRKKCTKCGRLKSMSDFLPSEEFADKKTQECRVCIEESQYEENNSKINNNNSIINKMATLKEKREAAKAAALEATVNTGTETTQAETAAPKEEKPKKESKVGTKTGEGHTVVGEKKASVPGAGRGRKKREDNRPVEQLDLETGTIVLATYPTIAEAAAAVGTNYQYLYDGLAGWTKSVAKFKWRYVGEEIYIRPKKEKTVAEKEFLEKGKEEAATETTVEETSDETPVPGDLDYDEELHGPKETEDDSVFEQAAE